MRRQFTKLYQATAISQLYFEIICSLWTPASAFGGFRPQPQVYAYSSTSVDMNDFPDEAEVDVELPAEGPV